MDDLETELVVQEGHESSDDDSVKKRPALPVVPSAFRSRERDLGRRGRGESGFRRSTRICLQQIREAMLRHDWQEAAEYMPSYVQCLEDQSVQVKPYREMVWRMGTEILHHHPNSKMEDYNSLYERIKHSGVKLYLAVSLEHALHLLVNGQLEDAKRQLSMAESWRYGSVSGGQPQVMTLIQAYRSFLDYFIWCEKRSTLSSEDDPEAGAGQEMHSYFRQSSVNLKEIIKAPGVWDPFVLSYIDMLEFYNDHEGALSVLNDYAYDSSFPSNPNAHVYLYCYLKRRDAPLKKLAKVLNVLHALVPSHELMLDFCVLLLQSKKACDQNKALQVCMDLLDYSCWRSSLDVWSHLMTIVTWLRPTETFSDMIEEVMLHRRDWWPTMHFTSSQAQTDFLQDRELLAIKLYLVGILCPSATAYSHTARSLRRQDGKRPAQGETGTEGDQHRKRPAQKETGTKKRPAERDTSTERHQHRKRPAQKEISKKRDQ